jgi:glycosyltransferase involved in cell wall biosynthesis
MKFVMAVMIQFFTISYNFTATMSIKLSVCIITFNEQKNIARCLDSIQGLADETVVVDSLSTDGTREICLTYGVTFIEQAFLGYSEQKNLALDRATHDVVLSLDADEALSPALYASIREQKEKGFPAVGYTMNRKTWYCDAWIHHGHWYPDTKLRLVRKDKARWQSMRIHEKMEAVPGASIVHLRGDILHYSFYSIDEHIQVTNKYSTISASAYFENGKRSNLIKLLVSPAWAFFSSYILKRGFLDGFYGYVISRQIATTTFLKYAKLYQLQQQSKAGHKTSS